MRYFRTTITRTRARLKQSRLLIWLRYIVGYGSFVLAILYSIYNIPDTLSQLDPFWLSITTALVTVMFVFELLQLYIFLNHHDAPIHIGVPIKFTLRKAILNTTLPGKSGTFFLVYMITDHYELEWHRFVRFMITATGTMFLISLLAAIGLFFTVVGSVVISAVILLLTYLLPRLLRHRLLDDLYLDSLWILLLDGAAIYGCRLLIFWTLIRGMGVDVTLTTASYFAISTNILAQIPITPGNIGVREVLFGFLAPFLSLPVSIGILVGAAFQVLRIVVYAILLATVEVALALSKKQVKSLS